MTNMTDEMLKQWEENLAKVDEVLAAFKESYGQLPGVMEILDDNWFGDTFVVGVDTKLYVDGSIPEKFQGFLIQTYPVYETLKSHEDLIAQVEAISPGDPHHSQFEFFHKSVDRLKKLIKEYESRNV